MKSWEYALAADSGVASRDCASAVGIKSPVCFHHGYEEDGNPLGWGSRKTQFNSEVPDKREVVELASASTPDATRYQQKFAW